MNINHVKAADATYNNYHEHDMKERGLWMASNLPGIQTTRSRIVSVLAFVDWNSQIHISGDIADIDPANTARLVLNRTSARIARCLYKVDSEVRFKVHLRLYHGWHKGFEPTMNRRAITSVLASLNYADLSPVKNVVFDANVGYGDCLLGALPQRLHERLGIHLPNTLRMQHGELSEKMVDTAMAADMVLTAASEPNDWIMIVAEDDDLIPPIFTAEALLSRHSSRVLLLQHRKRSENFLKLDKIIVRI